MDQGRGVRKKQVQKIITDSLNEIYPFDLQMYRIPPGGEIALTEFEDLALDRLQLLRTIEQATHKGLKLYSEEWVKSIQKDILETDNLKKYYCLVKRSGGKTTKESSLQARRADHISHFILRLAYCRSADLRRWFVAREIEFFRLRFQFLNEEEVQGFLDINNISYTAISSEEKEMLRDQLYNSTRGVNQIDICVFYKIPFTEVGSLVSNRKVYVRGGYAYVPPIELVTCVLSTFRAHLNEALAYASQRIPMLDDCRLNDLLSDLHTSYTGIDYSEQLNAGSVNPELIEDYSTKHFPLCMRHIQDNFKATHHLKYGSRMQYGLFIKGIGVHFEAAMRFWREEFTRIIDDNTFDKKYLYWVKHMYGKVGSMLNYSPYGCMKIISTSVGPGDHHGCPFRHFDVANLKQKMSEYGVNQTAIQEILDLVKNNHYQIACSKYFEHTHPRASKQLIQHPNQYFEESIVLADEFFKPQPVTKKTMPVMDTATAEEIWDE